ncbi:MAG: hypothetical protein ACEQR8_09875 [Cypionkella sp.]
MDWIAIGDSVPADAALIFAEGEYYLAVLVSGAEGSAPAFMEVHSADLTPWPSHWMPLPAPPRPA